jgi:hypothetical protein
MEDAVEQYASWMKHAFFQETSRRRREQERQRLCVLCLAFVRQPGLDVCAACQKDHWKEEQRLTLQLARARKAGTPATLTLGQWITTLQRYHHCCAYCHTGPYEVMEHALSLTEGTTQENCVPACRSCTATSPQEHPFDAGSQRIDEATALEQTWREQGDDQSWIEARLSTDLIRHQLTDEWKRRRAEVGPHYAILTDAIHRGTFSLTTQTHKAVKHLPTRANLRELTPFS